MKFFKRPKIIRRYTEPTNVRGYITRGYNDISMMVDVQTTDDTVTVDVDGKRDFQRLKVFCDEKLLLSNQENEQRGDRLWYQDKWFECKTCRLSENTPLKHYTATFIECLEQEPPPDE